MPITSAVLAVLVITLMLAYLGYIVWAVALARHSSSGESMETQHQTTDAVRPEADAIKEKVSGSH
jgi:flagellar basal body-associated protein FliL